MGMDGGSLIVHVRAESDADLLERVADVQKKLASKEAKHAGIIGSIGPATFLPAPSLATARAEAFSDAETTRILADFDAAVAASDFTPRAYAPYRRALGTLLQPASAPTLADLRAYPDLAETVLPSEASAHDAIVHVTFANRPQSRQAMQEAMGAVEGLVRHRPGAVVTGMSVISQRTLDSVQRDLPRVAILAIGCIAAYLAVHYRSLVLAILAVVPMLCSLILLLAVMRLNDISLNVVNMVMLPLLLGINIDFGIFAADALRERAKTDERFVASMRAMLVCSLTTIIGFGSLATTSIPAVRSLGVLVIVGVAGCVLGTAFVLWPIVLMVGKRGTR
jgi:predicted RND superfamily exporter protein